MIKAYCVLSGERTGVWPRSFGGVIVRWSLPSGLISTIG